jgi:hypothetical protein
LAITFTGVPAGHSVFLVVGTSVGDGDVAQVTAAAPGPINITVPAVQALFLSAVVQDPGLTTTWVYSWVYGVGDGAQSVPTVASEAIMQHLVSKWRRSELAAYEGAVEIPDPSEHGHDEICPVMIKGATFNTNKAADVAPFAPSQVWAPRDGTGYLECSIQPFGAPVVEAPGCEPLMSQPVAFDATLKAPVDGPKLALQYSGPFSKIFNYAHIDVNRDGVFYIDGETPAPEFAEYQGYDDKWEFHRMRAILTIHYRGHVAGAT